MAVLCHDVFDVINELGDLKPPFSYALRPELLVIRPRNLSEGIRSQQQLYVGLVEGLLPSPQSRLGLLVGMIKVDERDSHSLRDGFEMMMIKRAHLSTFILALAEILLLCVLEGALEEELLILIRSLPSLMVAFLDTFKHQSILFIQLLQLDIVELVVVEVLAEQDVEVGLGLGGGEEGEHLIGERSHCGLQFAEHEDIGQ